MRMTSRFDRSRSQTSDVSRSWMNAIRSPAGEGARERARSVAAIASRVHCEAVGASRRVGVGTPPNSSFPIQLSTGSGTHSLLDPLQCGEDEAAQGGEMVIALLHEDRRKAQRAEEAPGFAIAAGRDLERALGVFGGCV